MTKPQQKNQPSNQLIYGAGLIGGYLAGCLINAKFKPILVARPRTIEAMANGLHISDFLGNEQSLPAPKFIQDDEPFEQNVDILWLTLKCTSIETSIGALKKFIGPNTTIICCQNGLGSDKIIADAFPKNPVLRAIFGFNVVEKKPGYLHRSTQGELVFESNNKTNELANKLNSDLLPVKISNDITAQQWAKLQINLSNALNALSDIPLKAMMEDRAYRKIMALMMQEMLAVTDTLKLELPKLTALPAHWFPKMLRLPNGLFKILAKQMLAIDPTARLSMWWDLSVGKKTEIEFLNGALVQRAQDLGIDCPVNQKMAELIKEVELGNKEIGMSAQFLTQQINA